MVEILFAQKIIPFNPSITLRSFHGTLQIRKMDALRDFLLTLKVADIKILEKFSWQFAGQENGCLRDFHPTLKVTDIKMKPRLKTNLTDFKISPGHVHWPSYILLECISHYSSVPTVVCWRRCDCHFLSLREAVVWGQVDRFQTGCIPTLAAPLTGHETLGKGTNFSEFPHL